MKIVISFCENACLVHRSCRLFEGSIEKYVQKINQIARKRKKIHLAFSACNLFNYNGNRISRNAGSFINKAKS